MLNEKWSKMILGGLFGATTYGAVKYKRKEQMTLKGIVISSIVGGISFPLMEPHISKILERFLFKKKRGYTKTIS